MQMIVTAEEGAQVLACLEEARQERERLAKLAKHYILNFDSEMQTYLDKKREYMSKRADANVGIRGGLSKPTEAQALKSIKFDQQYPAFKWLKTVEILHRGLGERKNMFLEIRIEAAKCHNAGRGRRGWVGYVQVRYAEALAARFFDDTVYADKTIRGLWRSIVDRAVDIFLRI
jgi:hypothetical protein